MDSATFHIHGELNDFLSTDRQHTPFPHTFDWRGSIKDMIESFGIPHTEVGLLVVDDKPVDFEYIVQPGNTIHVYDHFHARDLPGKVPLRPPYRGKPRFVLDTHLGRLAGYLRLLGFDTLYRNDYPDDELAQVSHDETRILLTRDIGLLKRSLVIYGRWIRATNPREKLAEVITCYDLIAHLDPFTFCMRCNGSLHPIEKAMIRDQLQPRTLQYYNEFHQCNDCGQIYWKGSHYEDLLAFVEEVRAR